MKTNFLKALAEHCVRQIEIHGNGIRPYFYLELESLQLAAPQTRRQALTCTATRAEGMCFDVWPTVQFEKMSSKSHSTPSEDSLS